MGRRGAPTVGGMFDLVIRGGAVVDGTGAEPVVADVAVSGGRIAEIGQVDGAAGRTVDADGLAVAPGFVDPHTHYDAQLFWDPAATPSPLHGVTTVLGGNCGFSLAPVNPDDARYLQEMMAMVEGMPLPALEQGLPWDWETFGQFLDRLDGQTAVNAGFLVGHSALRRYVMGSGADQPADPGQLDQMVQTLHEGLAAGGLGFSTSLAHTHWDGNNEPVPSRFSSTEEVLALAGAVADHPGTWLEFITSGCLGTFSDEEIDLMSQMSARARRPLNWNVLTVGADTQDRTDHQLGAADAAAEVGGRIVALSMPTIGGLKLCFDSYCPLYNMPGWKDTMNLPRDEKKAALADPEVRRRLHEQAQTGSGGFYHMAQWHNMEIGTTYNPANDGLTGRRVGDIAAERGQEPFDTLCDIVLADDLRTDLWPINADDSDESWAYRAEHWRDQRVIVGGSDAGAHLDRMCGTRYFTIILGDIVRDRGLLPLAEAVRLLTDVPARLFGLTHRGRVAEGWHADLVVFDPDTVASESIEQRADLPGGCARLHAGARGIHRVLVAGTDIVVDGQVTGATPGTVLRSGRDTETVLP